MPSEPLLEEQTTEPEEPVTEQPAPGVPPQPRLVGARSDRVGNVVVARLTFQ